MDSERHLDLSEVLCVISGRLLVAELMQLSPRFSEIEPVTLMLLKFCELKPDCIISVVSTVYKILAPSWLIQLPSFYF